MNKICFNCKNSIPGREYMTQDEIISGTYPCAHFNKKVQEEEHFDCPYHDPNDLDPEMVEEYVRLKSAHVVLVPVATNGCFGCARRLKHPKLTGIHCALHKEVDERERCDDFVPCEEVPEGAPHVRDASTAGQGAVGCP